MQVQCQVCKKMIEKRPSYVKSVNFCSKECYHSYRGQMISGQNNPMFGKKQSDATKQKMSQAAMGRVAHNKGKKINISHSGQFSPGQTPWNKTNTITNCANCNKKITTTPYRLNTQSNVFCDKTCFYQYQSKNISGQNNPNYGKHMSQKSRQKLSNALKGRVAWNKGKKTTTTSG